MSLSGKSRHQDRCVSCGRLQARFDNHIDVCYACLHCSQHGTCPICADWPAEHWASLAERRARRGIARKHRSLSLMAPQRRRLNRLRPIWISLSTPPSPTPLPFSPPVETAQEGDASVASPGVETFPWKALGWRAPIS